MFCQYADSRMGNNRRSVRVYGLFGGNKENSEKGDDARSKVNETNLCSVQEYVLYAGLVLVYLGNVCIYLWY